MSYLGPISHRAIARAVLVPAMSCLVLGIAAQGAGAVGWLPEVSPTGNSTCAFLTQSPTIVSTKDGGTIAAWQREDDATCGQVGAVNRVEVGVRPPGGSFGAPQVLSNPALDSTGVKLAADAAGNVIAVWVENGVIRYSLRPAGGGFSAANSIPGAAAGASAPDVSLGGNTAVVAWVAGGSTQVAIKPAGSDVFGVAQTITIPVEAPADVDVDINEAGAAVLTWQTIGPVLDTLHAAARPPGGAFGQLADIFTTTANNDSIRAPQVEVDPTGRATAVWTYFDSASNRSRVRTAERGVAGNFGTVDTISNATVDSAPLGSLDADVDSEGNVIAVWWGGTIQAAYKPAGGSFGPVIQNISAPNFVITTPHVAFDAAGRAIAVWLSPGGPNFGVQGAVLNKGTASFGPVGEHALSSAGGDLIDGPTPVALDDVGNGVSIWRHALDTSPALGIQPGFFRLESAALDTVAPVLSANIPSSGIQDVPINVSATATDRLSAISFTWNFGDGATANGAVASHAFTKSGTYTVTVTATDGANNASSVSGSVTIPPIPATGPDPRLTLNDLRVIPNAFRAATKGPTVKSGALKPWTRVTYKINIPARVRFTFESPRAGRRSGSRCAKPAPSNRKGKRCIRYVAVKGSFSRKRPAGGDRFTFTGRLLNHRLRAGSYRLVATATANGRSGVPARRTFRILAPRTK
jgi:hypothetical protein